MERLSIMAVYKVSKWIVICENNKNLSNILGDNNNSFSFKFINKLNWSVSFMTFGLHSTGFYKLGNRMTGTVKKEEKRLFFKLSFSLSGFISLSLFYSLRFFFSIIIFLIFRLIDLWKRYVLFVLLKIIKYLTQSLDKTYRVLFGVNPAFCILFFRISGLNNLYQ